MNSKRILIRKDSSPDPQFCWYYTVEHEPRQEDALDYGSCESWQEELNYSWQVLAAERAASGGRVTGEAVQGRITVEGTLERVGGYPAVRTDLGSVWVVFAESVCPV
jgi:hypothetical protein